MDFTLTLQAREQHIRRAKRHLEHLHQPGSAGDGRHDLHVTHGCRRDWSASPSASHARTAELVAALTRVPGVRRLFTGPYFHESVIGLDRPVAPVLQRLAERGILGRLRSGRRLSGARPCVARLCHGDQDERGNRALRECARRRHEGCARRLMRRLTGSCTLMSALKEKVIFEYSRPGRGSRDQWPEEVAAHLAVSGEPRAPIAAAAA